MAEGVAEVEFVPAVPGWEVLQYRGTDFVATPVVAWAIGVDGDGFVHVQPITADGAWHLDDLRYLRFPDDSVTCGQVEYWPATAEWFAAMKLRDSLDPEARRAAARERTVSPPEGPNVASLANYRDRFRQRGE